MNKLHLYDYTSDEKVPYFDENKRKGYKMAICGYQREKVTNDKNKVTCKLCLSELN